MISVIKSNMYKKLIAVLLIAAFLVSFAPSGFVSHAASQTITIDASKVKTQKSQYYKYDAKKNTLTCEVEQNIILNMDADLELSSIDMRSCKTEGKSKTYGDFTIKGTHKLKVNGFFNVYGNYYQESGTNVEIYNGWLYVSQNAVYKTNSNYTVLQDEKCKDPGTAGIFAIEGFYSSGNINIKTVGNAFGIFGLQKVEVSGGVIKSKNEYVFALAADGGPVTISGGELYLESEDNVLYSHDSSIEGGIKISGGYVELKATGDLDRVAPVRAVGTKIIISDPLCIKEPENGYIKEGTYDGGIITKYIVDENGETPGKVIIDISEAAKKAAEEAAKKAAEEEAAKKASEEAAKKASETSNNTKKYSNEWVNGKWYNSDGVCNYEGILSWKCNSTGWWVEDTLGWYPVSQWLKIDGKWYYFTDNGYMDYSEYRDGCWLGSDGAWVEEYYGAQWKSDSNGWWFEDQSGWYPQSQWLWIDGKCYYFKADGYMATNCYIDGYWLNASGVYEK